MYKVEKLKHEEYGRVITITRDGELETPFAAIRQAKSLYHLWLKEKPGRVRLLIDAQVMSIKHADHWANQEYREIPKCEECAKILGGDVFNHQLTDHLFCSRKCADQNYSYLISLRDEEEECDL